MSLTIMMLKYMPYSLTRIQAILTILLPVMILEVCPMLDWQ